MDEAGIATFETTLGACGLAWSADGLVAIRLTGSSAAGTIDRLRQRHPGLEPVSPPAWVGEAIVAIVAHLDGGRVDMSDIPLDFSGVAPFEASVYREARKVPAGKTLTYGELADRLGDRNLARAVGQALGRNPWPIIVPCHRITAADGRTGGFSAPGGAATKLRLLELEGALAAETLPLFAAPAAS